MCVYLKVGGGGGAEVLQYGAIFSGIHFEISNCFIKI